MLLLDTSGLTEERSGQESLLGVGRQCGVTGTGTCFVCHINTQHGVITPHTQDQTVRCQELLGCWTVLYWTESKNLDDFLYCQQNIRFYSLGSVKNISILVLTALEQL